MTTSKEDSYSTYSFSETWIYKQHMVFMTDVISLLNYVKEFNNGLFDFSEANQIRIYNILKNNDNIRNLMKILSYMIRTRQLLAN